MCVCGVCLLTLSALAVRTGLGASPLGPPRPRPGRPTRGPPRPRLGRPRSPKLMSSWDVMSLAGFRKWWGSSNWEKNPKKMFSLLSASPTYREDGAAVRFLPWLLQSRAQSAQLSYPDVGETQSIHMKGATWAQTLKTTTMPLSLVENVTECWVFLWWKPSTAVSQHLGCFFPPKKGT